MQRQVSSSSADDQARHERHGHHRSSRRFSTDTDRSEPDVAFSPSEVKLRLLGPNARWADEVWHGVNTHVKAASALEINRIWLLILASTVICDVAACAAYRTSTALSGSVAGGIARYAIEAQISAISLVDFVVQLVANGYHKCHRITGVLDIALMAAMVACNFCDLFLDWRLPFTAYYVLRTSTGFSLLLDKVVDAAVDRKIIEALGDIFYILPDNATARPSDGFFVLEKIHLRPQALADVHAPVTIKGGFVELAYIDLDTKLNSLRKDRSLPSTGGRFDRSSITSPSGVKPEQETEPDPQDSDSDSQDLEAGTAVDKGRKASKVNIILRNFLVVLGPGKDLGKEAWDIREICANKDKLVQIITRRTELLVGRPRPKRESQEAWQPPPTVLGRLRKLLHRGPLSRLDLTKVNVDIQNVEVLFEDSALLPRPMTCGVYVGKISMRLESGHKNSLRTRGFRAFPQWLHERRHSSEAPLDERANGKARSSPKYRGDAVDTFNDERCPPVRIACCMQPLAVWCDLWSAGRDAFREKSFTHRFSQEYPEISKLVAAFKRGVALRKLKLAAVEALRPPEGDSEYPLHVLKEKILNHRFVLLPLVVSFHSMVVDARARVVTEEEGELDSHPQQVSDLEVSQVALQADREQVAHLLKLVRMIQDWMKTDAWISRKPRARLRDTPPRFQYGVAHDWWVYAAREIAHGIAPSGKLAGYLGARRSAHSGEVYQQLLYERFCANSSKTKRPWQKGQILERYDEQIKSLQVTLPISLIVRGRTMAKQWHLAAPQKVDLNEAILRTALDSSIISLKSIKAAKSLERARAMFKTQSRSMGSLRSRNSSASGQGTKSRSLVTAGSLNKLGSGAALEARPRLSDLADLDEPSQAHIRIGRISAVLLEPPRDERGVRKELVCLRVRGLSCIWTRAAPQEHLSQFKSSAANVLDHANQGDSHIRAAASSIAAAASDGLLGPLRLEEIGHCWQTLEVSVQFFAIVYCQAPLDVPMLRRVLVRDQWAGGRKSAGRQQEGGNAMICLRAVFDGEPEEEEEGPPHRGHTRGVMVVHCCALQLVRYQPLVDLVEAVFTLPPGFRWEDPLQLQDIQRRMKVLREVKLAARSAVRAFERATSVRDLEGNTRRRGFHRSHSNGWRCFAATAGVRVAAVRPLTGRFFLLQQLALPAGRQTVQRQSFAPYFSLGLSAAPWQQTGTCDAPSERSTVEIHDHGESSKLEGGGENNHDLSFRHDLRQNTLTTLMKTIRTSFNAARSGELAVPSPQVSEPQRPPSPPESPPRPRSASPPTSPPPLRPNLSWVALCTSGGSEERALEEIVDHSPFLATDEAEDVTEMQGWLPVDQGPCGGGSSASSEGEVEVQMKVVKWTDLSEILQAKLQDSSSEESSMRL